MPVSKQNRHIAVSATLDKLRERIVRVADSASIALPWTEAEWGALLRVMPDQVFRIKLQPDDSISIIDDSTRVEVPADAPVNVGGQLTERDQPEDSIGIPCEELARLTKELLGGFQMT